jgi:hypothetical protein
VSGFRHLRRIYEPEALPPDARPDQVQCFWTSPIATPRSRAPPLDSPSAARDTPQVTVCRPRAPLQGFEFLTVFETDEVIGLNALPNGHRWRLRRGGGLDNTDADAVQRSMHASARPYSIYVCAYCEGVAATALSFRNRAS